MLPANPPELHLLWRPYRSALRPPNMDRAGQAATPAEREAMIAVCYMTLSYIAEQAKYEWLAKRTVVDIYLEEEPDPSLVPEIDKAVLELWPHFDHKRALMRAYKAADHNHDGFIRRREFRLLLKYIMYFDSMWQRFDEIDRTTNINTFFSSMRSSRAKEKKKKNKNKKKNKKKKNMRRIEKKASKENAFRG